jgi:hypothetical protein
MENQKTPPSKPAIKWALIYAATSIVLMYVYQFLNVDYTSPVRYVNFLIFIGFTFLAQVELKNQLGGYATFGEEFLTGFLFALFASIIVGVFTFVYFTYLNPAFYQQIVDAQRQKLVDKGLSSDQVDTAMNITRKYGPLISSVFIIFGSAIFGAIISLIGAAIFKKDKPVNLNEGPAGAL